MNEYIKLLKSYLLYPIIWVFSAFLIRVYEAIDLSFFSSSTDKIVEFSLKGFVFDTPQILAFSFCLLPIYILLSFYKSSLARGFMLGVILLYTLIYLLLLEYFRSMLVPLDNAILNYTLDELEMIVSMSSTTNYWLLVSSVLITLAGPIILHKYLANKTFYRGKWITYILLVFMLFSTVAHSKVLPKRGKFEKEFYYYVSINKCNFFITKIIENIGTETEANTEELLSAIQAYQSLHSNRDFTSSQYPLLHKNSRVDVLGEYFNCKKEKPNVVFIIVESLGRSISGNNASVASLTPFLDSLSKHSLCWDNFLSNSERTFGVLPNIFGSLPFGSKGFNEIVPELPNHQSLINIFNDNGYTSNFFYGGWSYFDRMEAFLKKNNVSNIRNETHFDSTYTRMAKFANNFSWGYHDADLYKNSLRFIDSINTKPRLDIFLTLSTHSPWNIQNEEYYFKEFDAYLETQNYKSNVEVWKDIQENYKQASCFFYSDASIRNLMNEFKKREGFNNTIFIITGDHRQSGFKRKSDIDTYHVPLIIYSPMLKKAERFSSVSTHLNIAPTIINFLCTNYNAKVPNYVHFLGDVIDTHKEFRNTHNLPFIKNNKSIVQYISGNYFYYEGVLYKLKDGMYLEKVEKKGIADKVQKQLDDFISINSYVCDKNKIYLSLYNK